MIGAASSHDAEPRWNETHCDGKLVSACMFSSENIAYDDG
jgi:hypothetical protein